MSGITNPAEEYFKDGLWSWATSAWEKLVSSGGRLFTALHGWDGSAWRKLSLVWGYSNQYMERIADYSAAAGTNTLTGSTVPAGEVWVVTSVLAHNNNSANAFVVTEVNDGTTGHQLRRKATVAVNEEIDFIGNVVLKEGDKIQGLFYGCTAGDDLLLHILGYKMMVTE